MSQDKVSQQAGKNSQTLNITLLGSEWKSSKGGLSTFNRELAIYLSQIQNVRVSLFVPEGACDDEDKREAESLGINVLEAKNCVHLNPLVWLSNPPQDHTIDVIIGHGLKLGCQVQLIKRIAQFQNCKWVHVVHTSPEDLSKFKDYDSPISKGEKKHWAEVELCKYADLIVTVGPKLREIYDSYLQRFKNDEDIFELIPGLFDREFGGLKLRAKNEKNRFEVLLCGRGDEEDFELKGYNIAVKAIDDLRQNKGKHYFLRFVGAPEEKQDEVWKKLLNCVNPPVDKELLTVRKFVKSREGMKDLFSGVDMVIMPSKSEGFGLVALEALSAGLPILVGSNSGFAKAIETIPFGKYCIVDSEDPAKWAEAIESVRVRHKVILQKIKLLKEQYSKEYCWKRQCEELVDRLQEMVCETPTTQVVAAHEKQPRTIRESVCQQPMEGGSKRAKKLGKRAKKLGKRAKKLGKRRILESEADCGDAYRTPSFSEQDVLDQGTGIWLATAVDDKEMLGEEEDTDQMMARVS
ncbi:D-inositol 3-phosphate glycosyltransferase-like [Acropora millepora]|uniref:D-inositol 3-phosphate glycosyltransferase-like n=1 Tax=Acropora millepora TaxID=45264 RepID=UPI001CF1C828|nr:D-inositol 3-phosphate glycosyltransferase-like [Acropora millepora]